MARYEKQIYPSKVQPLGDVDGQPASGFFAMHITYPDTEYSDEVIDWSYGTNSGGAWNQGLTVVIKTPLALSSIGLPTEANNVITVDLSSPASQVANLGTEKAARIIAAKINSRRVKQVSERRKTRLLRARYVRMSGKPTYTGNAWTAAAAQTLRVKFDGGYRNGFPSDLPPSGTITYNDSNHTNLSLSYSAIAGSRYGPKRFASSASSQESIADFTITGGTLESQIDQVGNENPVYPDQLSGATFSIAGEPEKHTVVLSWEQTDASVDGGYWAAANGGPVIQGIGAAVPIWYLAAKPMDGGNMGLPATNHDSRGSTAVAHTEGHGYVRFSIEGLNSCDLPDMPPPDYNVDSPSISGITKADSAAVGSGSTGTVKLAELEYGTTVPASGNDLFYLKSAYQTKATSDSDNMLTSSRDELNNMTYGTNFRLKGIQGTGNLHYPRPIFSAKSVNTERVNGLRISNEHMVFEDITTTDDQGNVLTLKGGSPLGVVIKDFAVQNVREDISTGKEVTGPSAPDGKTTPNLKIQLPDPSEIPGEIFVRSGHDRVQAWSNMTWGLGGLTAPDPRAAGVAEASGGVSQFDTHDRMLIFHCKRLLHGDLTAKHGLTPPTTAGAVPSGSTRLYSAHRITDHAERGSVLTQTNNGTATGYPYPHHRIRFARQGHSFVTPLTHRGTPYAMRRQLHRSHGSAYSLLFEAETEHKHFGFGSGKASNTSTVFELDTLKVKGETGFRATGSFSSEGLPLTELDGFRLPDIKATYSGVTPKTDLDYLIAPGQEHTETTGVGHLVRRGSFTEQSDRDVGGPTRLTLDAALPSATRYNAASEFMINGFILGDYTMGGGRPVPSIISAGSSSVFVLGLEEGVIAPRVGTELATVPPLLCHDPEYLNMAARTPNADGISASYGDYALLDKTDTGTGATPDAFLCSWLAEYSHPALLGTVREHFTTFRYREAGMPRSLDYPPTKGLYLRNHSNPTTTALAVNAEPFERMYVLQWLQNYGYNGLNAGGHGAIVGLKSANSVLMGHTTVREPSGTLRLPTTYQIERLSRGEGIGDGINPEKSWGTIPYDADTDSVVFTKHMAVIDPMVAYDMSRRLPVRAWGFRTGSDALDMLAGDPTENLSGQEPIFGKARFDGGIHDSVQKIPHSSSPYGSSWVFPSAYNGVERSIPIGMVLTSHTAEATPFSSVVRGTNAKPISSEQPLGFGASLGIESLGLVKPTAMVAGGWEAKIDPNNTDTDLPLKAVPMNKGSDPFIDLVQYTGASSFAQANSKSAISSTQYGVSGGFHHLRGNALHTNASAVDHSSSNVHYPTTGWGIATHSNATINSLTPTPLSEIADHRQVQSRTEPRLGFVIQTENERNTNKNTAYAVTTTKAASLNTDLILGQQFPILPSWSVNARFTTHAMTIDPSSPSSQTISNPYTLPTWSPDTNAAKGGTDPAAPLVRPKTSAKDAWSVRGSADLPPWGGTYILRKTYLNRAEEGSLATEVHATSGNAATSAPRRKTVDYFVRPVRPLKLFGFASDLLQDGWVLGARSSVGEATLEYQTFTRDNRYGVFESDLEQTLGNLQFLTSSQGAFEITYPDANEYDVVYHLIPSASMLQFFKSDAVRKTIDGNFNPEVEPRYSQTTHPGGGEAIHQSETRYRSDGLGTSGDFAKQTTPEGGSYAHMDTAMRVFPQFKVVNHSSNNVILEDASLLPPAGTLFVVGAREIHYTGKTKNKLTGVTNSTSISDLTGQILRYYSNNASDSATPSALTDIRPLTLPHLVAPTFIDNTLGLAKQESSIWNRYDSSSGKVHPTALSYRGLLEYDPTDFLMVSQRPFLIENGKTTARIKNISSAITTMRVDGDEITSTNFPPYLFDPAGFTLRIAGVEKDELSTVLLFRNIEGDSLVDAGLIEGPVLMGQKGFVGVRTSDAVLTLLNDAGTDVAGYNVTPTRSLLNKDREISATLDAHPSLRIASDHSPVFSARKTRGLNIMELIRNMSQIDGKQLVNERNGALVYSSDAFTNRGARLSLASAIQKIKVSKMYDSPNEVVVIGDSMAANERVFVVIQDLDRMKKDASKGGKSNLVKTLRQEIPGLKSNAEALKLGKSILSRIENSVPLVKLRGAIKSSSIQPGEIIALDLPAHGLRGDYAVFEAKHNYAMSSSDFTVAQYDKGIEGILSDLQAVSGNTMPLDESAGNTVDVAEVSMSGNIRVVAVHRIYIRNVSNQGFIIGAKHSQGMGKIGVRDSNKRARAIGTSKSKFYEVK